MADVTGTVQKHYTQGTLRDRVFGWLSEQNIDPDQLTCERLYPMDQQHGRGIQATREHAEHAGIPRGGHVLDIGCGIGGGSRFLAGEYGCRVAGIDLTPEFVEVATELTRRCGLSDRVQHRQGNATDLPFDDGAFDHVWCHNVTMNIPDKAALVREAARVLRTGGRFSCAEVGLGPEGPPSFPLPWARDAASSFLVTPDEMREIVEAGGFRVIAHVDQTEAILAFRREEETREARGERPLRAGHIPAGDDLPVLSRNMAKNTAENRIIEHIIVAERV